MKDSNKLQALTKSLVIALPQMSAKYVEELDFNANCVEKIVHRVESLDLSIEFISAHEFNTKFALHTDLLIPTTFGTFLVKGPYHLVECH